MQIRLATENDLEAIWSILEPTIRAGETYALPRDMTREDALRYWIATAQKTFVAEDSGEILGTYALRMNRPGGGSHVANGSYMTAERAQGRGIARRMGLHSLEQARSLGYRAMQFNFVVSTNTRAVKLWESLGFAIVGRLPRAFLHPHHGYVDAFVMFQEL